LGFNGRESMKKEDREFLKELQHEMLTQDTVCQANPRFWVVMQTVRDYWVDDNIDGICIFDNDAAESVYEGELENIVDWIKEQFDVVEKCDYDGCVLEIVCKDGNEYYIYNLSELKEFTDDDASDYSVCYYRDRAEIAEDTMFLTLRECKEHIESNSHHYNKPHSYAMTAWRSPQVQRLYEILEKTDWESV
jgi:hypothetical protein